MKSSELLANLNVLRAAQGKKPLKVWKGTRAALEQAASPVVKEEPLVAKGAYENERVAKERTGYGTTKTKRKTPGRKPKVKGKAAGDTFTLSELAAELKIAPKAARAKMRKIDPPKDWLASSTAWVFKRSAKAKVAAALKA